MEYNVIGSPFTSPLPPTHLDPLSRRRHPPTSPAPTTASPTASPSCCGATSCKTTGLSFSASATTHSAKSSGTTTAAGITCCSATRRRGRQECQAWSAPASLRTSAASRRTTAAAGTSARGPPTLVTFTALLQPLRAILGHPGSSRWAARDLFFLVKLELMSFRDE